MSPQRRGTARLAMAPVKKASGPLSSCRRGNMRRASARTMSPCGGVASGSASNGCPRSGGGLIRFRALLALAMACLFLVGSLQAAWGAFTTTVSTSTTFSSATLASPTSLSGSCTQWTIGVRSSSSNTGGNSLVLSRPSGVVAGDFLVAQVASRQTQGATPSGWTLLRTDSESTNAYQSIYYRFAAAGDPASWTFTGQGALAGGIVAYTNVNTITAIETSAPTSGTTTTMSTASVTTLGTNRRLVAFLGGYKVGGGGLLAPTGMNEVWSVLGGTGPSATAAAAADVTVASAGATGVYSVDDPSARNWVTTTVALQPAATVALTWTASTSTWATQYTVERWNGASLQGSASLTPVSTNSYNAAVASGAAYTYKLYTVYLNWTSSTASVTLNTC
jgi:hypothetical protein